MSAIVHGGGATSFSLLESKKGNAGTSTVTVYTMPKDGFVTGWYVGHNESNAITVYLNNTQVGYSNSGSRQLQNASSLYLQLSAGDAIKVKGNSNNWCGYGFQFFGED